MSEFIYHIYYRLGFKMGKPHGLFRFSGEEKSRIDGTLFKEEQLMDLENDNVEEEKDTEDIELEGIYAAIQEKKNRL